MKIMVFIDWFDPGYNAGTTRSCANFVHLMKDVCSMYVFTSDRDLNSTSAYNNVEFNKWVVYDRNVQVYYSSPEGLSWSNIRQQIRAVNPDYIYLNSMFSRYFTIYPLLLGRLKQIPGNIVLAPRGMLRGSAVSFKKNKKKLFFTLFRRMGIHNMVRFHATDTTEVDDIRRVFGSNTDLVLAPDSFGRIGDYPGSVLKKEKELSIVFVGRLHPIKNLDYLLKLLPRITGMVTLTIVGSEEDPEYVSRCKSIIGRFGENIRVTFTGGIPNHEVSELIAKHHMLVLPTRGENFGHVIFEALGAGKPVLISDQTPWTNLASVKAGWDIPLDKENQFVETLQYVVDCGQAVYDEWSVAAWQYVRQFVLHSDIIEKYKKLFSN